MNAKCSQTITTTEQELSHKDTGAAGPYEPNICYAFDEHSHTYLLT